MATKVKATAEPTSVEKLNHAITACEVLKDLLQTSARGEKLNDDQKHAVANCFRLIEEAKDL